MSFATTLEQRPQKINESAVHSFQMSGTTSPTLDLRGSTDGQSFLSLAYE